MKQFILTIILLQHLFSVLNAQSAAFTDPAKAFNKLMLDKNGEGGNFERIGMYKVKGTSLYFGGGLKGIVFTKERGYPDYLISYNTYSQNVNIYDNSNNPIATRKYNDIDSFIVKVASGDFNADVTFISSEILQSTDNCFFQKLSTGNTYSLYKKYHCDLGIVTDNQFQNDLRQFDLLTDYYYTIAGTPGIKKIKFTKAGIIKEFQNIKDVRKIVEEGSMFFNPEAVLINVFAEINK